MRRITPEERELFLAALSGRLPVKKSRAPMKAKPVERKAAERRNAERDHPEESHLPGRRRATAEERELFLEAIGLRPKTAKPVPVILPPVLLIKPKPVKSGGGLDGNTSRRLERGELAPTAKLDLHGLTEAAAHGALMTFLHAAHHRGDRLVLVVTGKGSGVSERGRGILRQMVPRWLEEAPMAGVIAEKRWAHRRHGGEGALYVYLRKR